MSDPLNVVLLFTDDQRFDTIGALGYDYVHTPNMDRLVHTGVSFDHAYIPGGTVDAVCMPSRAMLHTGRTLFHLENHGETIPEQHVMLGEYLRQHGYVTYGTGKWHNCRSSYARSFSDGDEIFFGGMDDHWNVPVYHFDPMGRYSQTLSMTPAPRENNHLVHRECDHMHAGVHSSELFADASVRFLNNHDKEKPFFLYTAFMAPHDPRSMPKRFLDMYDPAAVELPESWCGGHPFDNGALDARDELLASFPRNPKEVRRHIAEYYAMISHLDHEIGRILDAVERNGYAGNTIIVFAGDNGLALGRHGLMGKQNVYDHSLHVPLVVSGPGIRRGVRTEADVYLLDIFASLCDFMELPVPSSVEGSSFAPVLTGADGSTRSTCYFAYGETMRAVQDSSHKLIEYAVSDERTTQLFRRETDPQEVNELSRDPSHTGVLKRMRTLLYDQAKVWGDTAHPSGKVFWRNMNCG